MDLLKKIIQIAYVNGIQVLSAIVLGFLIPKYLSIPEYANYKTFTLFASYIGFFHLGYVDGLNVDYGGKNIYCIEKKRLKSDFVFFGMLESIFVVGLLIFSIILRSFMGVVLALAIIPYNVNTYFKRIYQATDKLKWYSNNILIFSAVDAIGCLALIYIFKVKEAYLYCCVPIIANLAVCIVEAIRIARLTSKEKCLFEFSRYKKLVNSGFIILLGNLAVNLFYGIDRWITKIFFSTEKFSFYSFAVSMLNIMTTILQAISITLFSFLAKGDYKKNINFIKDIIIIIGTLSSVTYFILAIFVNRFLDNYIPSLNIIAITMAIFPYMIYINSITINLYKINGQEKKYLRNIIVMLIFVTALDLMIIPFKKVEFIAFATLVCYMIWYYSARYEDKEIMPLKLNEFIYLISMTIIYLVLAQQEGILYGVIYAILWAILSVWYGKDIIIKVIRNKSGD